MLPPSPQNEGFTLLELMIVVAILAIVASIGVPQYASTLRTARIAKTKQELRTIAQAIDSYAATNGGQLPLTLHQVGFGGRRDPWGVPYCYLNYGDGTGDGLQWAIEAGLVDPSAVRVSAASPPAGTTGSSGGSRTAPKHAAFLPGSADQRRPQGPGATAVAASNGNPNDRSAVARAAAEALVASLARTVPTNERTDLVTSLAEASSFAVFTSVPVAVTRRRDLYMFPLNSDYDLFSLGPNAQTAVSLGQTLAQDDIVRANDGGFFGTASDY